MEMMIIYRHGYYLNDGKAHFKKLDHAFDSLFLTASCIVPGDFNNDGFIDLFIGGQSCSMGIWTDSHNPIYCKMTDQESLLMLPTIKQKNYQKLAWLHGLYGSILIKTATRTWLYRCEWGGIDAFINNNGNFTKKTLTEKKGGGILYCPLMWIMMVILTWLLVILG